MQEIILAVSHAGWFSSELIRGIFILLVIFPILIINFSLYFQSKKRLRERIKEWEKHKLRMQEKWEREHRPIKRRKDHPLTKIFKNEMPKHA